MMPSAPIAAGDILAFSGRGWLSRLIALWTFGPSHVAVVASTCSAMRAEFGITDRLLLLESTSLADGPCLLRRRQTVGVQAHALQSVAAYPGRVWRLKLHESLSPAESAALTRRCRELLGVRYDTVGAILAGTTLLKRLLWWRTIDRTNEFCVEFCGEALTAAFRDGGAGRPRQWPVANWGVQTPREFCRHAIESGLYAPPERWRPE